MPTLENEVSAQLESPLRETTYQEGDLEEHMTEEHVEEGVYPTIRDDSVSDPVPLRVPRNQLPQMDGNK